MNFYSKIIIRPNYTVVLVVYSVIDENRLYSNLLAYTRAIIICLVIVPLELKETGTKSGLM